MVVCIILAIFLPLLAIVAGIFGGYNLCEGNTKLGIGGIITCIIMVILFIVLPWNFSTVDNGEVAVVKNLGEVIDIREPGMHVDFWMTRSYIKLDTKVRQVDIVTSSYSNDKQTMDINMTVQYQIKKDMAKEIVIHYGNLEMLEETWNNYQVYLNDEINFIDDEPMLNYSLRRED